MRLKFVFYKSRDGWRWHAKVGRKIVAESGEGYQRYGTCKRTLVRIIQRIEQGKLDFEKLD